MIPLKIFLAAMPLIMPVAGDKAGCRHYKPFRTETAVNIHVLDNIYEYSVPRKQLTQAREKASREWQAQQTDTAWATGDLTVEGLAGGGTYITSRASFVGKPYDPYGQYYCPFIKKLEIDIYYNTMIFIAREHEKGSCRFNAIMEHEHKHHKANVAALDKAVAKLHEDLPHIIAYMEARYVAREEVENSFDNRNESIKDALRVYSRYASELMAARNGLIDVPEEYERVRKQCAG